MRTISIDKIDRSRVKHDREELDKLLAEAWRDREVAVVLPFNVKNMRKVSAAKQRWDKRGWTLCAVTQLESQTIAVHVRVRYRGARGAYHRLRVVQGGRRG